MFDFLSYSNHKRETNLATCFILKAQSYFGTQKRVVPRAFNSVTVVLNAKNYEFFRQF